MKMDTAGNAALTYASYNFTFADALARFDSESLQMGISGLQAVPVIDAYIVSTGIPDSSRAILTCLRVEL